MLPESLIKKLRESNQLKQDWRDERLQTVKKNVESKTESSFTKTPTKETPSKKSLKPIFSHKFSEMSSYNHKLKKKIMVNYAEEIFGKPEKSPNRASASQSPEHTSKERKPSRSKNYLSINNPSLNFISIKQKNSPRSALTVSSFQKLDTAANYTPSSAELDEYSVKRQTYRSVTTLNSPSKFYKESEDRHLLVSQQSNTSLKDDLIRGFRNKISKGQNEKKYWSSILESPSEDVQTMRKTVPKTFGSLIKDITYSNNHIKDADTTNEKVKFNIIRGLRRKEKNNNSTTIKSVEMNSYSLESLKYLPKLEIGSAEAKRFSFLSRTSDKDKERFGAPPLKFRKNKEIF